MVALFVIFVFIVAFVALVDRSNVGKSSLINSVSPCLCGPSRLVCRGNA